MRNVIRQIAILFGAFAYLINSLGGQGLHGIEHAVVDGACCGVSHFGETGSAHGRSHRCVHHNHHEPARGDEPQGEAPPPHDHENCPICLYQSQAQKVALPVALSVQTGTVEEVRIAPVWLRIASPVRAFDCRAPPAELHQPAV
ncbi:MAG: DUF2946 domain-containing protein [Planctomycetota bacterium]|nr:MAG: DUF2946 domain-containing protein [Planctomycetota bacterium]